MTLYPSQRAAKQANIETVAVMTGQVVQYAAKHHYDRLMKSGEVEAAFTKEDMARKVMKGTMDDLPAFWIDDCSPMSKPTPRVFWNDFDRDYKMADAVEELVKGGWVRG